ncbi:MAG: branched-chain amino acid transport system ATP-binding protein [Actinomycetota bacterium]|nr:branched-chain amino acid transport system ATP-binding protein [Actinomycetota bacterium]
MDASLAGDEDAAAPSARPNDLVGAPALQVVDLHIAFGGNRAVDGATFDVPTGQLTGLIGPNGAGKSTVLKLVAGALRPTAGRVLMYGEDVTALPSYEAARRGMIRTFQLSSEFAKLTVLENLMVAVRGMRGSTFLGAMRGRRFWRVAQDEALDRAYSLLTEFELAFAANQYAGQLSGGQKRLVEIMRGLMASPKVLLLDEPLAGVNPTLRLVVEDHLIRLRDGGLTMVMVEHELPTVDRCCDTVIVMARGKVLAEGTMDVLRQNRAVVDAYLVG